VKKNSSKKSRASHTESNTAATVRRAKNAKIRRASKSVWRRINGHHFRNSEERGQGTKMTKNAVNPEPQYVGFRIAAPPTGRENKLLITTKLIVVSKPFLAMVLCKGRLGPLYAASSSRNSGRKSISQLDRNRRYAKIRRSADRQVRRP